MVNAQRLEPLPLGSSDEAKLERYTLILERLKLILADELNLTAVLATVVCEIHYGMSYSSWTGFYLRDSQSPNLIVGPYQGPLACLRIPFGKGVCGTAAATRTTQLVPDVHAFPGHIACSSTTLSEIVVPVLNASGECLAVLDLDSEAPAAFTAADATGLESICAWVSERFNT